jgi:hypothetical protein
LTIDGKTVAVRIAVLLGYTKIRGASANAYRIDAALEILGDGRSGLSAPAGVALKKR